MYIIPEIFIHNILLYSLKFKLTHSKPSFQIDFLNDS